jgi:hypothetical protein
MARKAVAVASLALLGLLFAFTVPSMIDATQDPQTSEIRLEEGETATVTEGLTIMLNESTANDATYQLTDTESGKTNGSIVSETSPTANYTLPGGDGTVTYVESTNQDAVLNVNYSASYGWNGGATVFVDNMAFILVLLALIVVLGILGVMVS